MRKAWDDSSKKHSRGLSIPIQLHPKPHAGHTYPNDDGKIRASHASRETRSNCKSYVTLFTHPAARGSKHARDDASSDNTCYGLVWAQTIGKYGASG